MSLTFRTTILALGLAGLLSLTARDAAACWDGYAAVVGDVTIRRGLDPAAWNPDHAREAARWGARIDALVPPGAELSIDFGETTCTSNTGACRSITTLPAGADDLPAVFRAAARAFGAKPAAITKAGALDPALYTVQIFAGSERGARRMATRVADLTDVETDLRGFFDEGGFPASNQVAHVLRDASGAHRAIVGVFLDRDDAEDALDELRRKGIGGFVRVLPAGKAVGEREYSLGG